MNHLPSVPGLFLGSPEDGLLPPTPLLTHWVAWDGGFNAWARPLGEDYMLLCSNEEGDAFRMEDGDGHPIAGSWSLGVVRVADSESVHESEASPLNVETAVGALALIDWRAREDL